MDVRDSVIYNTVTINDLEWLSSNVSFPVEGAFYKDTLRAEQEWNNYYGYESLIDVCPVGWRLPTILEWKTALTVIQEDQGLKDLVLKRELLNGSREQGMDDYYIVSDTTKQLELIGDSVLLGLQPTSWVEGKRIRKKSSHTLWVDGVEHPHFHNHLADHSYVMHGHDHNIVNEKPRNTRRFGVRCVRSKSR